MAIHRANIGIRCRFVCRNYLIERIVRLGLTKWAKSSQRLLSEVWFYHREFKLELRIDQWFSSVTTEVFSIV